MRRAVLERPRLHGVRDGIRNVQVERLTFLDGCKEGLVHVFGEVILHDAFREHHGPEAIG